MKRALIQPDKCQRCSPCELEAQCPKHAVFREQPSEQPWVDFYRCAGCLQCKAWCRHNAIAEIAQPCDGQKRAGW